MNKDGAAKHSQCNNKKPNSTGEKQQQTTTIHNPGPVIVRNEVISRNAGEKQQQTTTNYNTPEPVVIARNEAISRNADNT